MHAGQHQIWKLNLSSGVCAAFSGTGAEQNLNGGTGSSTAWAQPSGISLNANGSTAYAYTTCIVLHDAFKILISHGESYMCM
jgi:hypothetical protein